MHRLPVCLYACLAVCLPGCLSACLYVYVIYMGVCLCALAMWKSCLTKRGRHHTDYCSTEACWPKIESRCQKPWINEQVPKDKLPQGWDLLLRWCYQYYRFQKSGVNKSTLPMINLWLDLQALVMTMILCHIAKEITHASPWRRPLIIHSSGDLLLWSPVYSRTWCRILAKFLQNHEVTALQLRLTSAKNLMPNHD